MKLRLLEIERNNKSIEVIEGLLLPITKTAINQNTIDDVLERKLNLRVPFSLKGSIIHMVLPTLIKLEERNGAVIITCLTNIVKPFLLALLFGILVAAPVLVSHAYFIYALLSFMIFLVSFILIINRTIQTLKNCLKELKI